MTPEEKERYTKNLRKLANDFFVYQLNQRVYYKKNNQLHNGTIASRSFIDYADENRTPFIYYTVFPGDTLMEKNPMGHMVLVNENEICSRESFKEEEESSIGDEPV